MFLEKIFQKHHRHSDQLHLLKKNLKKYNFIQNKPKIFEKPPDVPPTGAVVPTAGPVKVKICNLKRQ